VSCIPPARLFALLSRRFSSRHNLSDNDHLDDKAVQATLWQKIAVFTTTET